VGPVVDERARASNYTNEAGLDGSVRFLKNLMGMWMLQECERAWRAEGLDFKWPSMFQKAAAAPSPEGVLDVNDARFGERCDMPVRIIEQSMERGIAAPASPEGMVRLVLESMAADHGRAVRELEGLVGHPIEVLNLVGGAARNDLLCQLIANAAQARVLAGPTEATALGNILVQARTLGDLPEGLSIRDIVRANAALRAFEPRTPVPVVKNSTHTSTHA
jgi:rhamnulokinase